MFDAGGGASRTKARSPVLIGTSGWTYKHWRGLLYPKKLGARTELEYYADRFETVELNNSFYRLPEKEMFESWRLRTPDGFVFAVKASRYLTHMKRLAEPKEPLSRLVDRASELGDKLGPVLFQLPRQFTIDIERLRAFAHALRQYPDQRFTFEFRHQSWLVPEVYNLLSQGGAALCLPFGMSIPVDVRLTTDWSYIRMHHDRRGIGFGRHELETWAGHIADLRRQADSVYVYFNNDAGGHALKDADRLRKLLQA